jgi:flagellar protein FliT
MSPMHPAQEISTYENIAAIMNQMCAAAQGADWKRLAALEKDCARLVALLQASQQAAALTPPQQRRKFELLRQILANDAEIRRHTEPWMENLKALIKDTGRTRQVNQAYGVGGRNFPGAG